jgi:Holliday junction resolvase RusA-like endonuclease
MNRVIYRIAAPPVSQQSPRETKGILKAIIHREIQKETRFLTGEVKLHLEWMIHDRLRYETDSAADVDNILKPTIDALCGPDGILIDDCQVQHVSCGWIDWTLDEQAFTIEIEYVEDEVIGSRQIFFVRFSNGLCFPLQKGLSAWNAEIVGYLSKCLEARDSLVKATGDYYLGLSMMPIQRFFHRSRIHGFEVIEVEQFLSEQADGGGNI